MKVKDGNIQVKTHSWHPSVLLTCSSLGLEGLGGTREDRVTIWLRPSEALRVANRIYEAAQRARRRERKKP